MIFTQLSVLLPLLFISFLLFLANAQPVGNESTAPPIQMLAPVPPTNSPPNNVPIPELCSTQNQGDCACGSDGVQVNSSILSDDMITQNILL